MWLWFRLSHISLILAIQTSVPLVYFLFYKYLYYRKYFSSSIFFLSIALLSTLNSHSGYHLPFFPSPEAGFVILEVFLCPLFSFQGSRFPPSEVQPVLWCPWNPWLSPRHRSAVQVKNILAWHFFHFKFSLSHFWSIKTYDPPPQRKQSLRQTHHLAGKQTAEGDLPW